jgi:putative peptidoglycan lipid II flippase
MSRLTRNTLILAVFFALDKVLALLRQVIIARQFGLSHALDVFNVANNIPDLLYALISGGALSVAFIPVLAAVLARDGRPASWTLFAHIANLAFIVTGALSLIIAVLAEPLVKNVIAPGFSPDQQAMVIQIMRLDLIGTMIFAVSGLAMAGLQANQHFLLPALAPLLYNLGQIFGALVLAPSTGYQVGGITLPAFGLGVKGLAYGVLIGASLHLAIQIPGLIRYGFRWVPGFGLGTPSVTRVLSMMGPRLVTVGLIQSTFVIRDNLASRLTTGAISSLAYGWMVMQVPETLIGTAIATAMLPTLSDENAREEKDTFQRTVERAIQVILALTLPVAVILSIGLGPLLQAAFHFDVQGTETLMWVTRGFLLGLMGQSILEVAARGHYARQNAVIPMIAAGLNVIVYLALSITLYRTIGVTGISLADSLAFTSEAILLLILLNRRMVRPVSIGNTLLRAILAGVVSASVVLLVLNALSGRVPALYLSVFAMALGGLAALPFIWKELRLLFHL